MPTTTETPPSHSKTAWVVILTAAAFFFYEFIQMNLFNTINVELRETFQLDAIELGQLFSMYFYANAILLFPAGVLLDRFSTKKLLLAATGICTIGAFLFALAPNFWIAAAGRFLIGCGAAFCFLSALRLASRWFPPQRMAFVTGVIVTMAMLGGLVAQTPFVWLIDYTGHWRYALLINAALGIFIMAAIFLLVQDRPPGALEKQHALADQQQLQTLGLWPSIKLATFNPQNWLGGIYTALMNLPVFILGGLWGILYLTEMHHITTAQAAYATTCFFLGVIGGSLLFGWISDWIERRVLPMIVGAILSLFIMGLLLYVPGWSLWSLITLFFLVGLISGAQVLTYPTLAELNPPYLTGTAVSIDSTCIMVSGFTFPPLFGWLMEQSSAHEVINDITLYTAADFQLATLLLPIAFIFSIIIAFFIRETYCKAILFPPTK
ncbi:MAG TPA: MFS transporter [Gammaproteobacteria bacterium]|jgi:MFS family permease|nr:MFS transporter [Gammaproteobacteria bacterium]